MSKTGMPEDKRALLDSLIKIAKEAAAMAPDEDCEILFTPENKYGTPYPGGTEMNREALRKLFLSRPASILVQ